MDPVDQQAAAGLVLDDVETGYAGGFRLSSVSFAARPGDVVGLIGPNGSGKSTLLKGIAGVLPVQGGAITLGGRPVSDLGSRVAFVPQREEVNWEFPVSAREVVLMGRYRQAGWLRRPGRADRAAADAALDRLGLRDIARRHISQYSGGQQQRIFLARAIVQEPLLVLLDEPFTGIDVENRGIFHQAIRDFAAAGAVVLMATHDLDEVRATCSHVCLVKGRVVAYGPTESTFTPENLRRAFGGELAVFA